MLKPTRTWAGHAQMPRPSWGWPRRLGANATGDWAPSQPGPPTGQAGSREGSLWEQAGPAPSQPGWGRARELTGQMSQAETQQDARCLSSGPGWCRSHSHYPLTCCPHA